MDLAPDPNTAKRGRGLAKISKWSGLSSSGRLLWGECKGSGAARYQTAVDTQGPAFKCNCPSRKFPCKHAIGLLFFHQSEPEHFKDCKDGDVPSDYQSWQDKRDARKAPQAEPKDSDPEAEEKKRQAKEKRFQERMDLMRQGVDDLQRWMLDLVRVGLASVQEGNRPAVVRRSMPSSRRSGTPALWANMAKRMVDAKLPGMGSRIRELELIPKDAPDWGPQVLAELVYLHLFTQGFERLGQLPEEMRGLLLSLAGVNTPKKEVLAQKGVHDHWMVLQQSETENIDNALLRRTWFLGRKTQRFALLIDFDYMGAGYEQHWPVGRIFKGEMVFYPGTPALRGLMKQHEIVEEAVRELPAGKDVSEVLADYADALGQNPWLKGWPAILRGVTPKKEKGRFYLVDAQGAALPLAQEEEAAAWKIMALSGGNPLSVVAEWTGEELLPLGVAADGRYVTLGD